MSEFSENDTSPVIITSKWETGNYGNSAMTQTVHQGRTGNCTLIFSIYYLQEWIFNLLLGKTKGNN